jgi:hypothetical protein
MYFKVQHIGVRTFGPTCKILMICPFVTSEPQNVLLLNYLNVQEQIAFAEITTGERKQTTC